VVAAVAWAALVNSPGWPRVRGSFLDPQGAIDSLPDVAAGMVQNLEVLVGTTPAILVVALALAFVRSLPGPVWAPLRWAAIVFIELARGVPLLIWLYLVGIALPGLRLQGIPEDPRILAGIALALVYGGYTAEVFRAGIESTDRSQIEAAALDGATAYRSMRHIVLPQAVRAVLPALTNNFVSLQKDCSLISVLGAIDAVRAADLHAAETYVFSPYLVAAGLFLLLSVPSGRFADWFSRRRAAGR
jgi:polar amino acid transport system permease protein